MDEEEISDYRLRQRNRARLRKAWKLYCQFVLGGKEPGYALEKTEEAMEAWGEYEDQHYAEPPAPTTAPVSLPTREMVPRPVGMHAPEFLGRWLTRDGSTANVTSVRKLEEGPGYRGSIEGRQPILGQSDVWWGPDGECQSVPTAEGYIRVGDWDLVTRLEDKTPEPRVPPPVSHPRVPLSQSDAPFYTPNRHPGEPECVPPRQPESQAPPKPPLDFSGRWITRGGQTVGVVRSYHGKYPYSGAGLQLDFFWDEGGRAVSPETDRLVPEYDLVERAPSPGGHRMDYPPEDLKKES
jgi:hypothetical protein